MKNYVTQIDAKDIHTKLKRNINRYEILPFDKLFQQHTTRRRTKN